MATGKRGITKNRGWIDADTKTYATLHPASLLYGSNEQKEKKANWILEDWLEIARVFLGKTKHQESNE